MGNNFDETARWKGRYRAVKARIATWPGMRRLSIRGRNLLLQSIFYGSFRYWLYFLIMPDPIIKIIELDAKQILWASEPTLLSNEEGTSIVSLYRGCCVYAPGLLSHFGSAFVSVSLFMCSMLVA